MDGWLQKHMALQSSFLYPEVSPLCHWMLLQEKTVLDWRQILLTVHEGQPI